MTTHFDVLIIGAGLSGINTAYRLQTENPLLTYQILEARDTIGGTWDLFKYPGVRSDTDLFTLGYAWRPWTGQSPFADGKKILNYIRESAAENGIDKKICFNHKLRTANWSTKHQIWTLNCDSNGIQKTLTSRFIVFNTGYYDYQTPLEANIPGIENFQGLTIHPQFWPTDLDYADKNIVVIGSGATAITLLPKLASKASHVTMLQHSPAYILSLPSVDKGRNWARRWLPESWAAKFARLKSIFFTTLLFQFCRAFPDTARKVLAKGTNKLLPSNVPFSPHFEPKYNPWEQRLCVCIDDDFFKSLHSGKASVVTGEVENISGKSIRLKDGQVLSPDIIITATGLKLQLAGGAHISIDDEPYILSSKFFWKGKMLQDLPNAVMVVGYSNASWTLGADATAFFLCRLLKYLDKKGFAVCAPHIDDAAGMKESSEVFLSSTYFKMAKGTVPKVGDKGPWRARASFLKDVWRTKMGSFDEELEYWKSKEA